MTTESKGYNFKFQFRKANPALENEFYRATFDKDTAHDLTKLEEEVRKLIPAIKKRKFFLTWADSDGDETVIANTEALVIATKELSGPVFK